VSLFGPHCILYINCDACIAEFDHRNYNRQFLHSFGFVSELLLLLAYNTFKCSPAHVADSVVVYLCIVY